MSKFYIYQEFKEGIPTKEKVIETRDKIIEYLVSYNKNSPLSPSVIFGSTAWALDKKNYDSFTRRSDVDIAVFMTHEDFSHHAIQSQEMLKEFCSNLSLETRVPIEITEVGGPKNMYAMPVICPSTGDHFKLLQRRFSNMGYKNFRKKLEVDKGARIDDLNWYIKKIFDDHHRWLKRMHGSGNLKISNNENATKILESVAKLENFPDHFLRKVFGIKNILPYPDTKKNVRKLFFEMPYQWKLRDKLITPFSEIFASSSYYDNLINDSDHIYEDVYYKRLEDIVGNILENISDVGREIYLRGLNNDNGLEVVKIPKGSFVVILNHYTPDSDSDGTCNVGKLEEDFTNKQIRTDTFNCGYLKWVKDPINPSLGWFTFESYFDYYSLKKCDEELYNELKSAYINKDKKVLRKYYKRFVDDALNPKYSRVKSLKGKIKSI